MGEWALDKVCKQWLIDFDKWSTFGIYTEWGYSYSNNTAIVDTVMTLSNHT